MQDLNARIAGQDNFLVLHRNKRVTGLARVAFMKRIVGVGAFGPLEEQVRRNMEMFERTFAMFAPFAKREAQGADAEKRGAAGGSDELAELERQMEEMQKRLNRLGDKGE